jgi:hypothetical protein
MAKQRCWCQVISRAGWLPKGINKLSEEVLQSLPIKTGLGSGNRVVQAILSLLLLAAKELTSLFPKETLVRHFI